MNMDTISFNEVFFYVFFSVIGLIIFYEIIRAAVKAGTKPLRRDIEKQNKILIHTLNQSGIDKDDLMDLYLNDKKEFWINLKNHNAGK